MHVAVEHNWGNEMILNYCTVQVGTENIRRILFLQEWNETREYYWPCGQITTLKGFGQMLSVEHRLDYSLSPSVHRRTKMLNKIRLSL